MLLWTATSVCFGPLVWLHVQCKSVPLDDQTWLPVVVVVGLQLYHAWTLAMPVGTDGIWSPKTWGGPQIPYLEPAHCWSLTIPPIWERERHTEREPLCFLTELHNWQSAWKQMGSNISRHKVFPSLFKTQSSAASVIEFHLKASLCSDLISS